MLRRLLDGAARLLSENVVDIFEGLFENGLRFSLAEASEEKI